MINYTSPVENGTGSIWVTINGTGNSSVEYLRGILQEDRVIESDYGKNYFVVLVPFKNATSGQGSSQMHKKSVINFTPIFGKSGSKKY